MFPADAAPHQQADMAPLLCCRCRDDGVGLAAPQVGVNVRLMGLRGLGVRGKGEGVSRGLGGAGVGRLR